MKILITGGTGNIGSYIGRQLFNEGHQLVLVSRCQSKAKLQISFPAEIIEHDLVAEPLPLKFFNNIEAVIHLMGESIDGRWSTKKKKAILESRKRSSENLIKNLPKSVQVVISASAQGIYGDQGDKLIAEDSELGLDFLSEVCKAWEKPFVQLKDVRTVQLRMGLVLDRQSGALKKMISLFQKGLGGVLASGKQYVSWISIFDLAQIVSKAIIDSQYIGPINCATNSPVTNAELTKILCESLGVAKSVSVPKFVLRIVLGEMADVVLSSIKMVPQKLLNYQFKFKHETLQKYLVEELGPLARRENQN